MTKHVSDEYYEAEFEFPLWKLIQERAEEKDISYVAACEEVLPEYIKTIRYGDTEFEESEIAKRAEAMAKVL